MTTSQHPTKQISVSRRKLLHQGVAISAVTAGVAGVGSAFAAPGEDRELRDLWQRWLDQGARTLAAQEAADDAEMTAHDEFDMAARREWERLAAISDQVTRTPATSASGRAVKAAVMPILALRNATAWQHVVTNGGNTMRLREALEASRV